MRLAAVQCREWVARNYLLGGFYVLAFPFGVTIGKGDGLAHRFLGFIDPALWPQSEGKFGRR